MVILNPLENLVLTTLVRYSAGADKILNADDIVTLGDSELYNNVTLNEFQVFSKQYRVNNVNSMVFLSDLEWSYLIVEGLWDLTEKVNVECNYGFTSVETLQIVTKNLTHTAEFISQSKDLEYNNIIKSPQSITNYLRVLLSCEALVKP